MDRQRADQEDSAFRAPMLSYTATQDESTLNALEELYSSHDDLLSAHFDKPHTSRSPTNHRGVEQQEALLAVPPVETLPLSHQLSQPVPTTADMSQHSSRTSRDSQQYQLKSAESPADQARSMSQNNKDQLISSLRTHKINTITELRRVEKIFAYLDSEEVTEPMTAAWAYYVNSNNLLNELRNLTQKIPFSSECLDEAKALVVADPASVRSWNYCWLVLVKIEKENLISKYARILASKQTTWGDRQPTLDDGRTFISACVAEWTLALRQLLRHWDTAPSTTGD